MKSDSGPGPVFPKFLTPGPKEKRRILRSRLRQSGSGPTFAFWRLFLSKNTSKLQLDRWLQPETEQESDSQIWKLAGPGFKNFGTGAESESEKVTPATSVRKSLIEGIYICAGGLDIIKIW